MYKKKIGNRLKMYRRQKNLSQREVADALHTTRQCISSWESDRTQPSYEMLDALAIMYGVSTDALFGDDDILAEFVLNASDSQMKMLSDYYKAKEIEIVAKAYANCSDVEKEVICRILGIDRSIFNVDNYKESDS